MEEIVETGLYRGMHWRGFFISYFDGDWTDTASIF